MLLVVKVLAGLVVILLIGLFVDYIARRLSNRRKTEPCTVVGKRTETREGSGDSESGTRYYVTFEFEDQSRKEFSVGPQQFELIANGDRGELTYRGMRFVEFRNAPTKVNSAGAADLQLSEKA